MKDKVDSTSYFILSPSNTLWYSYVEASVQSGQIIGMWRG